MDAKVSTWDPRGAGSVVWMIGFSGTRGLPGVAGLIGVVTGAHWAYTVVSCPMCWVKSTGVPFCASVDHPWKVYPARVGAVGSLGVRSARTVWEDTALPPWLSKVMV